MKLRMTVFGAGGSYPPPGYNGPCILAESRGATLLLDAGEGCLSALLRAGYHPCSISHVFLSHSHVDHWAGLPSIAIARSAERCGPPIVHTPWLDKDDVPETLRRLEEKGYIQLAPSKPTLPGLRVRVFPVEHTVPAYGIALEYNDQPLAGYTGDTMLSERLARELHGVRLLVAEATLPSGIDPVRAGKHMRVKDAVILGERTSAKMIALVHLSPHSLEEARRIAVPGLLLGEGYSVVVG